MIRSDIKFSFNQLETALIAFVADLESKINRIHEDIPVYFQYNGDYSYIIRQKFEDNIKHQDVIAKTPRVVINVEDIQLQPDQFTNSFNSIYYKFEDQDYKVNVRRVPLQLSIAIDFVSPNFIQALSNFEVISTLAISENIFYYETLGFNNPATYVFQSPTLEKPAADMGSSTRNFSVKINFEMQMSLLTPRLETIQHLSDTIIEGIKFGIGDDVLNPDNNGGNNGSGGNGNGGLKPIPTPNPNPNGKHPDKPEEIDSDKVPTGDANGGLIVHQPFTDEIIHKDSLERFVREAREEIEPQVATEIKNACKIVNSGKDTEYIDCPGNQYQTVEITDIDLMWGDPKIISLFNYLSGYDVEGTIANSSYHTIYDNIEGGDTLSITIPNEHFEDFVIHMCKFATKFRNSK